MCILGCERISHANQLQQTLVTSLCGNSSSVTGDFLNLESLSTKTPKALHLHSQIATCSVCQHCSCCVLICAKIVKLDFHYKTIQNRNITAISSQIKSLHQLSFADSLSSHKIDKISYRTMLFVWLSILDFPCRHTEGQQGERFLLTF